MNNNSVGPETQAPPRQSGHLRAHREFLFLAETFLVGMGEMAGMQGHMASREQSADRDFPLPSPSPRHSLGSLWGATEETCHFVHSPVERHGSL